jgi:hypothetical protein
MACDHVRGQRHPLGGIGASLSDAKIVEALEPSIDRRTLTNVQIAVCDRT